MNPMDELIAATDRLALAAERRDYSTGCAITVMNARAELAEAAKNARAALARTQSVAAAAPQPPAEAQAQGGGLNELLGGDNNWRLR